MMVDIDNFLIKKELMNYKKLRSINTVEQSRVELMS